MSSKIDWKPGEVEARLEELRNLLVPLIVHGGAWRDGEPVFVAFEHCSRPELRWAAGNDPNPRVRDALATYLATVAEEE